MRNEGLAWEQWAAHQGVCCGVDEAGRGPLAGPVVAAAVILPPGCHIPGLNDSKALTEKRREMLFDRIKKEAVSYAIGLATVAEIDEINILQATFLAMRRAVGKLSSPFNAALVDGHQDPKLGLPVLPVIKGDRLVPAISAASVLAKVERDRMMKVLDEQFPGYGLLAHKGYGTKRHVEALNALGPSDCHRRSFKPVRLAQERMMYV